METKKISLNSALFSLKNKKIFSFPEYQLKNKTKQNKTNQPTKKTKNTCFECLGSDHFFDIYTGKSLSDPS